MADSVRLSEHYNFTGAAVDYHVNRGNVNWIPDIGIPNDSLSYIDVGQNVRYCGYVNINFDGDSQCYDGPYSANYGTFNDVQSSFTVCKYRHVGLGWDDGSGWSEYWPGWKRQRYYDNVVHPTRTKRDDWINQKAAYDNDLIRYQNDITNWTNTRNALQNEISQLEAQIASFNSILNNQTAEYETELQKQRDITSTLADMNAKYLQGLKDAVKDSAISVVESGADKYAFLSEDDAYYIEM
jgi:hypothetical protein